MSNIKGVGYDLVLPRLVKDRFVDAKLDEDDLEPEHRGGSQRRRNSASSNPIVNSNTELAEECTEEYLHRVVNVLDDSLYDLCLTPRCYASSEERKKGM